MTKRSWQIKTLALLTALMGTLNVLSAITPGLRTRLTSPIPGVVRHGAHLTAVLAGFGLLLLAANLWRRKRMAWLLVLALLLVSSISHLLKGGDYGEAILAGFLAGWLWALRPYFQARSDPPSIRQGLVVLVAALCFTLAYGTLGFYLLDRHFSVNFNLFAALRQTVVMFTQFYDPGLQPVTHFGRRFAASIYVVGIVTFGYALWMLLRPVLLRQTASREERERARRIVENYGHSSLARFTLFPDKTYFFSPGGSVVAFAVRGRAAVALGDPIGPADDAEAAIVAFRDDCVRQDWIPAFYQVLPEHLKRYGAAGFEALHIGDEAIVELSGFTLESKEHKSLRSAVNRLTKAGYRAEYQAPPLSRGLLEELRVVSDEWLAMMHGREKQFSLGWFDEEYLGGGAVFVVRGPNGKIEAFANLVPEYQKNELTLDLMRRRRDVASGTMDFLFVNVLLWARERRYETFNLGLSALSGVGQGSHDPLLERALHSIYEHVNQFYNFQGLHTFKAKFRPCWEPRYLIYPGKSVLPAVALAIIRADAGDAFLRDYLRELRPHRRSKPKATDASE